MGYRGMSYHRVVYLCQQLPCIPLCSIERRSNSAYRCHLWETQLSTNRRSSETRLGEALRYCYFFQKEDKPVASWLQTQYPDQVSAGQCHSLVWDSPYNRCVPIFPLCRNTGNADSLQCHNHKRIDFRNLQDEHQSYR